MRAHTLGSNTMHNIFTNEAHCKLKEYLEYGFTPVDSIKLSAHGLMYELDKEGQIRLSLTDQARQDRQHIADLLHAINGRHFICDNDMDLSTAVSAAIDAVSKLKLQEKHSLHSSS